MSAFTRFSAVRNALRGAAQHARALVSARLARKHDSDSFAENPVRSYAACGFLPVGTAPSSTRSSLRAEEAEERFDQVQASLEHYAEAARLKAKAEAKEPAPAAFDNAAALSIRHDLVRSRGGSEPLGG